MIEIFKDENVEITEDMKDGYNFVLTNISEKYQRILELRYKKYMTLEGVGKEIGANQNRVSQLLQKSLVNFRNPKNFKYIKYGKYYIEKLSEEKERRFKKYEDIIKNKTKGVLLEEMAEISARTYLRLKHKGFKTLNEVCDFIKEYGQDWYRQIPDLEIKSKLEVEAAIELYGLEN